MDGLAALLDGPRARGAFLLRCLMEPPWSVRLEDESPLAVTAVVDGEVWAVPDAGPPFRLGPGDVVVTVGTDHWTIADSPGTPVEAIIHPGQHCTTPDGRPLAEEMHQGVRSWGNSATGSTVMLTGAYALEGEVSRRLLRALPRFVVLTEEELGSPLVPLLADEIVKDAPGQDAVLDRLLDLLLIAVLRAWFSRPEASPPAWYVGQSDPVVGPALRLLQHHPDHPWTVASLAAAGGVSRAAFARRFTEVVGEPPMTFLTGWRLALAADLLRDPSVTVASVARQVGYSTPFALSTAFKREYGVSPREHRLVATAPERPAQPRSNAARTSVSVSP
ncbi:AraC family transcriptional regulator [Nocardioides sp. YIM 152315]|uniref:AraC family transcriptional regulator n=1 Tax=Nocardioides sp. YIM 152315 TaxID=3031760 RepID=UPI0023DBDDE6|nr:AraC family transcriptional regulator [Nocardioides sp. YIM 152315]MDF1605152.1 AraC family transcriptional regulator [Nocardioides sp. YIM 152315]